MVYEQIMMWMSPGVTGKLIFEDRPNVYYEATVSQVPKVSIYPTRDEDGNFAESAVLTFYFICYNPYGMLIEPAASEIADVKKYTGYLDNTPNGTNNYKNKGTFLIHNPGSYESDTVIQIAGTAPNGVKITNMTNGDVCSLLSLPSSPDYLELSSRTGIIQQLPSHPDDLVYSMHDDGFIRLAPSWPSTKTLTVSYRSGSNSVTVTKGSVSEADEGLYIRLNNQWLRVANVSNATTFTASASLNKTATETTTMTLMNEIKIEGTGATLTTCNITFVPYLR